MVSTNQDYILGCPYKTYCRQRNIIKRSENIDIQEFDRELCDTNYHACGYHNLKQELNELHVFQFN